MKQNEAPEKIYIHRTQHWGLLANEHNITKNGIEYTRTDTFIKKAYEWLKSNLYDYAGEDDKRNIVPFDSSIFEDFKKAMKGD